MTDGRPTPDGLPPQPFATINRMRELSSNGQVLGAYLAGFAVGVDVGDTHSSAEHLEAIVFTVARPVLAHLDEAEQRIVADVILDVLEQSPVRGQRG